MKKFACLLAAVTTMSLVGLTTYAQQAAPAKPAVAAAPVKAEADATALLKQVLQNQRDLDAKLADIQKRLDSISTFLGDQRASTFDSVDRRLRDIQDDIKRQR
jgi:peptidoglycan hydrolase CwlO-like protein